MRSDQGCWTCRLRKKKCSEEYPVCVSCTSLQIPCHYSPNKPDWMDGGARQEEMAQQVKREVKEMAHRRREEPRAQPGAFPHRRSSNDQSVASATMARDQSVPLPLETGVLNRINTGSGLRCTGIQSIPEILPPQHPFDDSLTRKRTCDQLVLSRSDTVLLMFYLEHTLPFLFPFYLPCPLQGGRAWVIEMVISSPVVRKATLCLSSYCFSLARGLADRDLVWQTVLKQTQDAFGVLSQSLQFIAGSNVSEHLHGAVRILSGIQQLQRFELAVLSFENCQAHLNAALALFHQLLDSAGPAQSMSPADRFRTIMSLLGPGEEIISTGSQLASAEQAAFRFSTALLILDDIIASTVVQEEPKLQIYYPCLLESSNSIGPPIDLESVIGCQNWVLIQIGNIAVLDVWKQACRRAGNLDVMELVRRASTIKTVLHDQLTELETTPVAKRRENTLLDVFLIDSYRQLRETNQSLLVTRVWAHAAFLYLGIVVSGWQPANPDVRYHVGRILEIITQQVSPPALLRTMVWPFCVAGCLAEPAQEARLRDMVEALQPPSIFGTVRKALEIMEDVWRSKNAEDVATRDLATCFKRTLLV